MLENRADTDFSLRSLFDVKSFCHGFQVRHIACQSVTGFGGMANNTARENDIGSFRDIFGCGRGCAWTECTIVDI